MTNTLTTYPHPGALSAARLRGLLALQAGDTELLALTASFTPDQLVAHFPNATTRVPWGCLLALRDGFGVLVTEAGTVTGYHGAVWTGTQHGLGRGRLCDPVDVGWIAALDHPDHSHAFPATPTGALDALAVHGIHAHISRYLPNPDGLGGEIYGPHDARLSGLDAQLLAARTPAVWARAARLYGVGLTLDAFATGVHPGTDVVDILQACYPGLDIGRADSSDGDEGYIVSGARRYVREIRYLHSTPDDGIEVTCWTVQP